ncbi:hypothetical protein G7Y89_g5423 [Cudoniella acicularis]|uniref:Uncharacterized protein n=1 Tax=Cudoniella acicularis TaxID=354080 RepID=A0A8H4RP16_9HELO|nr:hypothetical protein G7Y89_g5423 [Cudoniella acicularis]
MAFYQDLLDASKTKTLHRGETVLLSTMQSENTWKSLAECGAHLDAIDNYGRGALHHFITSSSSPEQLQALIDAGLDYHRVDNEGRNILHIAAAGYEGTEREVQLLGYIIGLGLSVNAKTKLGQTTTSSQYRGISRTTKDLYLWITKCDINNKDTFGRTALHDTCASGRPESVYYLLKYGADITSKDFKGRTPLLSCAEFGSEEKRLGLDSNDFRFHTELALSQRTPLKCRDLPENARQEIFRHPSKYIASLNFDDVDWLMENEANLTGADSESIHTFREKSFLHVVASHGLTEIMERLGSLAKFYDDPALVKTRLLKGGYENKFFEDFKPALHVACGMKIWRLILLLAQLHFTVLQGQLDGGIPMQFNTWSNAALTLTREMKEEGHHYILPAATPRDYTENHKLGFWGLDCVRLLLDLGANPNALDNGGKSALNKADISPKAMKPLLERGAEISVGKTSALFSAIQSQNLESLRVIFDAGADPNTRDTAKTFNIHYEIKFQERWALFCALFPYITNRKIQDSAPLAKLLIERGANLYNPVSDTETLIHYVFEHAEYEIVCAFLENREMINFDSRDQLGRTGFLAACNSTRAILENGHKHGFEKNKAPAIRMLEYAVDLLVVDSDSRNVLHHLLENSQMEEGAVLQFLKNDAGQKILHQKDKRGFTPLNSAFRFLRPVIVEALLAMGANLLQPDPNGATALHQITTQCLLEHEHQRRSGL